MSNETTTGAPLAATLGERLEEKAHEGDAAAAAPLDAARSAHAGEESGVDRAERAVADLREGGQERPQGGGPREGGKRREGGEARGRGDRASSGGGAGERLRAVARRPGFAWAVGAGLGTYLVVGMIGRLFRR